MTRLEEGNLNPDNRGLCPKRLLTKAICMMITMINHGNQRQKRLGYESRSFHNIRNRLGRLVTSLSTSSQPCLSISRSHSPLALSMTTLVTGGTGKTGLRLALLLDKNRHSVLLASRSGSAPGLVPLDAVEFDWLDESTYANPFSRTSESSRSITRIYLVAPTSTTDCLPPMKAFIDYARKEHNVKRFVLLSSSALPEGGLAMGRVHAYLKEIGKEGV